MTIKHIDLKPLQVSRVYAARHRMSPYKQYDLIIQCSWCRRTKISATLWEYVPAHYGEHVSHGVCPTCYAREMTKIKKGEKPCGTAIDLYA